MGYDGWSSDYDCDDVNPSVYPGAPEMSPMVLIITVMVPTMPPTLTMVKPWLMAMVMVLSIRFKA